MSEPVGLVMPWTKKEPMEQRIEFAIKALRTDNFRALCAEYGISAKTGYKWRERFLEQGLQGMGEHSRRPSAHADQLSEEVICQIVRLKLAHRHWGARKLRGWGDGCGANGAGKRPMKCGLWTSRAGGMIREDSDANR